MDLNIKKCNIILLMSVAILFFVAALVLIKILFSGSSGFEWGSVSDWVSAISTFLTLCTAIVALCKVPDWLNQKQYDVVHQIIEDSIYNDLQQVRTSSLHLKTIFVTVSRELCHHLSKDISSSDIIHDAISNLDQSLDKYQKISYSIINNLNKISRNGFQLSEYSLNIQTKLTNHSSEYLAIYNSFFIYQSEVDATFYADIEAKDILLNELRDIQRRCIKLHQDIANFTSEIYKNNYPISKFILSKHK
ncbi:hypothetical protein RJ495_000720 [Pluralibacter gergoviae]|nr:hypothetical protein [Pluralibacter gergoviae]